MVTFPLKNIPKYYNTTFCQIKGKCYVGKLNEISAFSRYEIFVLRTNVKYLTSSNVKYAANRPHMIYTLVLFLGSLSNYHIRRQADISHGVACDAIFHIGRRPIFHIRRRRIFHLHPYGVSLVGPLNINIASLIGRPRSSMVRRSTPMPKPPWGGQP